MSAEKLTGLFLSHGSPMMVAQDIPAREFLKGLGTRVGKPSAVVVLSAHWTTRQPVVGGAAKPETIHDFYGFPDFLYQLRYPAAGAPALAQRVADLLQAPIDPARGLDHGVWTVMSLIWPDADIPVVPLSVLPNGTPADHYALGQALRPLAQDDVLVIGSGAMTHNLRAYFTAPMGKVQPWVTDFTDWFADATDRGDLDALLNYRALAPHAEANHPSDEHLLPFFAALGAGPQGKGKRLHASLDNGVLAMDNYGFW